MTRKPQSPRETFAAALERRPIVGQVPTFELVFFLTMEAFGRVHPQHRDYAQWDQMRAEERDLHRDDIADLLVRTADRFGHAAIVLHANPTRVEEVMHIADRVRHATGDRYFLLTNMDPTFSIPSGDEMPEFCYRMVDDPEGLKEEAEARVAAVLEDAQRLARHGAVDGITMCADYCFNRDPFLRPEQFHELVFPYLRTTIAALRELDLYVIKHTDGNILPILDDLLASNPHALHSLDPQGGIDMADIKARAGNQVCLIGNVNCSLLDTGSDEEYLASARYALRHGMPDFGYIFSTSNCVYTGMRLSRYERLLELLRTEGRYG